MDKQIKKTILWYSYFKDVAALKLCSCEVITEVFYARYCAFCAVDMVKPRKIDYVIRDACKALGITTKRKYYHVFCEKVSE